MDMRIFLMVLVAPIALIGICYMAFPRATKNFAMKIVPAWNKRYVVCHLRYQAGLSDTYLVIPNLAGLTQVGKYSYLLEEKYAILVFLKRMHFVVDEADTIPKTLIITSKKDIIFQASEIQTALDNNVMEYLFSKKKEILLIGLFLIAIIATLAIVYNIMELNSIKSILEQQTRNVIIDTTAIGK